MSTSSPALFILIYGQTTCNGHRMTQYYSYRSHSYGPKPMCVALMQTGTKGYSASSTFEMIALTEGIRNENTDLSASLILHKSVSIQIADYINLEAWLAIVTPAQCLHKTNIPLRVIVLLPLWRAGHLLNCQ